MNKLTLKKPVTWEGKEYTELPYDMDKLTGEDIMAAENKIAADGVLSPVPMITAQYQAAVFAIAAGVDYDMLRKLCASDFVAMTQKVKVFLNDSV